VFVVHETTSELESRDLIDPVIYRCMKHRQLAHQKGGFVACFPLNILMVHTSMLAVITDGKCLTYGGLSLGETVCFRSLKFIADYFGSLSLSPKGNDSGTVFVGMTHGGSPSLQTILENSTNEFYTTSSGEGSSGFPISQRSSMGTPPPPIATIPWPEDALTSQTMTMVPLRTIAPRPDTELPPER
jgi:hypothetical protein